MCAATQVSGADAMSNGGSERKLIGKWRLDFVANAGDPSLSAFPGTPSNHIQQPPECLLMALSGHRIRIQRCLLSGVKQTLQIRPVMSAYDPSPLGTARTGHSSIQNRPPI